MNILKIDTDRNITEHKFEKDAIGFFHKLIKCDFIEIVAIDRVHGLNGSPEYGKPGEAVRMIVDEEGLLTNKKFNVLATVLYGAYSEIVGDVAIAGLEYTDDGIDICGIEHHAYEVLKKRVFELKEVFDDAL